MAFYAFLKSHLLKLWVRNSAPTVPTREQKIDWAYGNAAIENPQVTRSMVADAVDSQPSAEV